MKELVPIDEFGIFASKDYQIWIDSRYVADKFGKEHKNVLQSIEQLECSEEFGKLNFQPSYYKSEQGKKCPCYLMTRDGFTLLVMGYRGKRAMKFKEAYIQRFNQMEKFVLDLNACKDDFKKLSDSLHAAGLDVDKPYAYSTEVDMIYKIVTGKISRKLREEYGIGKDDNLKSHLPEAQVALIDKLYRIDQGLIYAIPDYHERKAKLEEIATNL